MSNNEEPLVVPSWEDYLRVFGGECPSGATHLAISDIYATIPNGDWLPSAAVVNVPRFKMEYSIAFNDVPYVATFIADGVRYLGYTAEESDDGGFVRRVFVVLSDNCLEMLYRQEQTMRDVVLVGSGFLVDYDVGGVVGAWAVEGSGIPEYALPTTESYFPAAHEMFDHLRDGV